MVHRTQEVYPLPTLCVQTTRRQTLELSFYPVRHITADRVCFVVDWEGKEGATPPSVPMHLLQQLLLVAALCAGGTDAVRIRRQPFSSSLSPEEEQAALQSQQPVDLQGLVNQKLSPDQEWLTHAASLLEETEDVRATLPTYLPLCVRVYICVPAVFGRCCFL